MRRAIVVVALAVLALPATAMLSIYDRVETLREDLTARINAIEAFAEPLPDDLKERAGLVKTRDQLDDWEGTTGVKDLGVLAKALGTAYKATGDPGVVGGAQGLRGSFVTLGQGKRSVTETARDALTDPAHRAKITAAIDKAMLSVTRGGAEPDWGKGAKLVLKGHAGLDKAKAAAEKLRQTELVR